MDIGLCAWLYELFPGGVEKIVHKTTQNLNTMGHAPTVFCAGSPFFHPTKTFGAIYDVPLRRTLLPFHPYSFHARFKHRLEQYYIYKTTSFVRRHPCAIFHGMSINALCGTRAKKKTVATIIGLRGGVLEEELLRTADCFVVLAEKIRQQLIDRGVPDNRIHTIYQGVDAAAFDYILSAQDKTAFILKHILPLDKRFIAAVHNFSPKKRTIDLIEAFAKLQSVTQEYHLLLSGIGDTTPIRDAIAAYGLEDCVSFVDVFGHETEVSKIYKIADFFVLPGETFKGDTQIPLVLFEALCAGIPIISANVGAVNEVVTSDVGRLVEPASVPSLFDAMKCFVCGDAAKYSKETLVRRGYVYDWQTSVRKLENIYSTL